MQDKLAHYYNEPRQVFQFGFIQSMISNRRKEKANQKLKEGKLLYKQNYLRKKRRRLAKLGVKCSKIATYH